MKKQLPLLLFLFFFTNLFCFQRTLYVDNFNTILGDYNKEEKLFLFAKKHHFTTLMLYQLNKVDKRFSLTDVNKNNVLANFISKAKSQFNIEKIGAIGESSDFFKNRIDIYNSSRAKPSERFDVYNLEFEYWSKKASGIDGYYCVNYLEDNKIPCTREGSFQFFLDNLKELKLLSKNSKHKITIEAYVGFYTQNEISQITKYCDRLVINSFGKNPKLSFSTSKKSLENLLKINSKIKTSILFSTNMDQLGYWLKYDSLDNAEKLFFNEMNYRNINLKKGLNLDEFSYQSYTFLEKAISYFTYSNK